MIHGKTPKQVYYLRKFGELGVITKHATIQAKISNKGFIGMFWGYSDNHASDTYRFLNLKTERIVTSRDVRWLNLTHQQYVRKALGNLGNKNKDYKQYVDESKNSSVASIEKTSDG